MRIEDVKTVMLTDEPVKWNNGISDGIYRVKACCMKLTGGNRKAPTQPFYYTLILQDVKAKHSTCEVLIGEVERCVDTA